MLADRGGRAGECWPWLLGGTWCGKFEKADRDLVGFDFCAWEHPDCPPQNTDYRHSPRASRMSSGLSLSTWPWLKIRAPV